MKVKMLSMTDQHGEVMISTQYRLNPEKQLNDSCACGWNM